MQFKIYFQLGFTIILQHFFLLLCFSVYFLFLGTENKFELNSQSRNLLSSLKALNEIFF